MPTWATLGVFALAALALLAVPGPSVLYIVTQSIRDGRRAGLVSMLGIQTGALVHVTAAALGLSALIASSATAFDARQVRRRRLPRLPRRATAARPRRARPDRPSRADRAEPPLHPGDRGQRAEPEDGAVLLRPAAAVRRPGAGPGRGPGARARALLHRARARQRRALGRVSPGRSASGCGTAGRSGACSATSRAASSSGSASWRPSLRRLPAAGSRIYSRP